MLLKGANLGVWRWLTRDLRFEQLYCTSEPLKTISQSVNSLHLAYPVLGLFSFRSAVNTSLQIIPNSLFMQLTRRHSNLGANNKILSCPVNLVLLEQQNPCLELFLDDIINYSGWIATRLVCSV